MNKVLRDCYKGIAYMYYHPKETDKQKILDDLLKQAWQLGYPRGFFDNPSDMTNAIVTEDMTEWELKYVIR